MSQRRLARLRRVGAADEAGGRDRVVGRAERALGDEARAPAQPGDRLDARDLDRLVGAERRQDRRQAPGDHRLARARRALQEQVVPAGGGDLEPEDEPVVAADVREIGDLLAHRCRHRGGDADRRLLPTQGRDQLGERLDADDLDVRHQRGLARPRQRQHELAQLVAPRGLGDGERAPDRPHLAGQRELADDRARRDGLRLQLAGRDEERDREREVERRPDLAQVGRREVDRDPPQRELVAGVHERGPDALARLAHRLVGEPDHGERGQAEPDVGLDPDPPRVHALDGEGDDPGEHQRPPGVAGRRRRGRWRAARRDARRWRAGGRIRTRPPGGRGGRGLRGRPGGPRRRRSAGRRRRGGPGPR